MKERIKRIYQFCRAGWITLGISLMFLLLFELFKNNRAVMNAAARYVTTPFKQGFAALFNWLPFSMAELLIILAVAGILVWIAKAVVDLIRRPQKGRLLLRKLLCTVCAVLAGWGSFSLLWGVNYYTDTFQDLSGVQAVPLSVEELAATAAYFAQKASESAAAVPRDGEGHAVQSLDDIFSGAGEISSVFDQTLPYLPGKCHTPKRVFFSEVMSLINCTGFFFPYSGEANINVHSPTVLIPATIAHELAHQRAVASEQEANFIAVYISTRSGIPAYEYSGWLLGYIYLNNALYAADRDRFEMVYGMLSGQVRQDLADNSLYWSRYETPVSEIADAISDQRLKSYGQSAGMKSYGDVVDLLVAWYERGDL